MQQNKCLFDWAGVMVIMQMNNACLLKILQHKKKVQISKNHFKSPLLEEQTH